jgi:hypothetical protein
MKKSKRSTGRKQSAREPVRPLELFYVNSKTALRRDALAAVVAGRMLAYQSGYHDDYDLADKALSAADEIIAQSGGE